MNVRLARFSHLLFAGITVEEAFVDQRTKALTKVDTLPSADLVTADLPRLRHRLVDTYRINALRLEWDARTAMPGDDGATVGVFVPFLGAAGLFHMSPSRADGEHPTGWVREHELVLVLAADRDTAQHEFDRQRVLVTDWVARINADVEPRNETLARTIRTRVAFESDRARATESLALDFGPTPRPSRGLPSGQGNPSLRSTSGHDGGAIQAHPPGRRRASRESILDRYDEASLATPEPRTMPAIAAHFRHLDGPEIGITPRHLRRLLRQAEKLAD